MVISYNHHEICFKNVFQYITCLCFNNCNIWLPICMIVHRLCIMMHKLCITMREDGPNLPRYIDLLIRYIFLMFSKRMVEKGSEKGLKTAKKAQLMDNFANLCIIMHTTDTVLFRSMSLIIIKTCVKFHYAMKITSTEKG